ncbi:MAG: hypothetical protein ABEI97_00835 [Candidatus Nanohaloarchaea archaeon]
MHRSGISFSTSTMVKILLIVLALAVLFGFVNWAVGGVSTLLGYIQWGASGELSVDSYNIDPSANPPFTATFTYTNTGSSDQDVWVVATGAGGEELARVPQSDTMTVQGHGSTRESIEYTGPNGGVEPVGCQFTLEAKTVCEPGLNLCGFRMAHARGVNTIVTTTQRIPKDRRPDAWGEECPSVDPDEGGGGGILSWFARNAIIL